MRRTREDTEATRKTIVDAAYRVFRRKGYAAATMNDIAAEIRMSRGAVYWHFSNKTELFTYLLNESLDSMIVDFKRLFDSPLAIRDKVRQMLYGKSPEPRFFELIRNFQPGAADLDSRSRAAAIRVVQRRFNELFESFLKYLTAARAHGQIRKSVNIEAFAVAMILIASMVHSPSPDKAEPEIMRLRDKHRAAIADLLFSGLESVFA
jgi:AcrR family transcriptional regulator